MRSKPIHGVIALTIMSNAVTYMTTNDVNKSVKRALFTLLLFADGSVTPQHYE